MIAAILIGVAAALSVAASPVTGSNQLKVERIVIVMRHGVRPPTKDPALPPAIAPDPWPRWPVPPGWLTPHGAAAVRMLGRSDRAAFAGVGLIPAAGCAPADTIAVMSDSDERTIATGDAYLEGIAPGCGITNSHLAQDVPDPLFHDPAAAQLDPAQANKAVVAGLGPDGIAGVEQQQHHALQTLDQILCGTRRADCGASSQPSAILPATPGKLPRIGGALELGSSAAQSILLEYADGKPMSDVGWGRARPEAIAEIGALHSAALAALGHPSLLAAAKSAGLVKTIIAAMQRGPAKITLIVGHDTNIASLAGLLNLHWQVPGFAADDPPPGGALMFELVRDAAGHRFVRVFYRAQTLEQLRTLRIDSIPREILQVSACIVPKNCPLGEFKKLISDRPEDRARHDRSETR